MLGKFAVFLALIAAASAALAPPEQLHLSLTEREGEMRVMYVRPTVPLSKVAKDEMCQISTDSKLSQPTHVDVNSFTYTDGGFLGSIYTAVFPALKSGTRYYYQCGSIGSSSLSTIYSFKTGPAPLSTETITIASFGDMGAAMPGIGRLIGRDSSKTQALLNADSEKNMYDLIVNVGDSSYANDIGRIVGHIGNNSYIYDQYFNQLEPTIARAPMMLCPGNHESEFNYAPYLNRTLMPIQSSGPLARFYNSFDYGPIHFVTFSTERGHDVSVGSEQYSFLESDLARVNRTLTPWIVAFSHHPLYCADILTRKVRCGKEASAFRVSLEPLFSKYKVDLFMNGHNHIYERSWPTYENKRVQANYIDSKATVYVTNGAAGDMEGTEPTGFDPTDKTHAKGVWGFTTGYMRMFANRTSIAFEYVNSERNEVIDAFEMVKN